MLDILHRILYAIGAIVYIAALLAFYAYFNGIALINAHWSISPPWNRSMPLFLLSLLFIFPGAVLASVFVVLAWYGPKELSDTFGHDDTPHHRSGARLQKWWCKWIYCGYDD